MPSFSATPLLPPRSTLFPYTTLFRSLLELALQPLEKGEGIGGSSGKPTDDIALAKFADLLDRKSTRPNSSHANISYAVFCLKKNTCGFATDPHARLFQPARPKTTGAS